MSSLFSNFAKIQTVKHSILIFIFLTTVFSSTGNNPLKGTVFSDTNRNGVLDPGEPGIAGVCVSNGREVVLTDARGNWELPGTNAREVFVIKPANYATPVNENFIPQHYLINDDEKFPAAINFPLLPSSENPRFSALFFGDTQARGIKEVNYILHDVVEELMETDAAFGVSLGDIVADDPNLFDEISQGIGQIGIPWYNIFGNHDFDRGKMEDINRDKTFRKFFGPSTYAFEYGQVVFIGFRNMFYNETGKYHAHLSEIQLNFTENYLTHVPEDKLVVLMMHIPVYKIDTRERLFEILKNRKYTFSIAGHEHEQWHTFVDREMGWKRDDAHHHLVNATVCGSWWCGSIDETGIPHATMNDGAPNGYSIITFYGNDYSIRFKAARRPDDYQMNIYLPDEISQTEADTTKILVNVFAGSERSVVEMRLGKNGEWLPMQRTETIDPECLRMHELSPVLDQKIDGELLEDIFGYKMDYPSISQHIWQAEFPKSTKPGTYTVTVRTKDMFDQSWQAHRLVRVK